MPMGQGDEEGDAPNVAHVLLPLHTIWVNCLWINVDCDGNSDCDCDDSDCNSIVVGHINIKPA